MISYHGEGGAENLKKSKQSFLTFKFCFMKRSRIIMAVGTFALAVSAMFATKANKKFANNYVGTLYYGATKSTAVILDPACGSSPVLFTTVGTSRVANPPVLGVTAYGIKAGVIITLFH
jgi:hypothetical protein